MLCTGNYRQIEGVRLFWQSAGRGAPVVLVHGYLASHRSWERVLEPLAASQMFIALDLPGHGESACLASYPYTVDAFSHSVAVLLDSLGLSRITLVGHSLGGGIALNMAVRYPERVERLVLVSPAIYPMRFPLEGRLALLPGVGELIFKRLYRQADLRRYFRTQVYADPRTIDEELLRYYWERFNRPGGRDALYRTLRTLSRLELLAGMPGRVKSKTLVIWGENDRLVGRDQIQRLTSELADSRLFTVAKAGHAPQEERPTETGEALVSFLRD